MITCKRLIGSIPAVHGESNLLLLHVLLVREPELVETWLLNGDEEDTLLAVIFAEKRLPIRIHNL